MFHVGICFADFKVLVIKIKCKQNISLASNMFLHIDILNLYNIFQNIIYIICVILLKIYF